MLDEMPVNDVQLNASDIRQLENADEMAHFFAKLRYDADQRTNNPDCAVLGIGSEQMRDGRNKAAHDAVLSRDEAQQTRSWAMKILLHV